MQLSYEERSLLDYIHVQLRKTNVNELYAQLRDAGIKKAVFEETLKKTGAQSLKQKLDEVRVEIKLLNNRIKNASKDVYLLYETLKKDERVQRVVVKGHTMCIVTTDVKVHWINYGSYEIHFDFDDMKYFIKGKRHPFLQSDGRIHVCSDASKLTKFFNKGDFYRAALILLSLLFRSG